MPFIAGDAFDDTHLETVPAFYSPPDTPVPQLAELSSLNPLRGHVSAIHASSFFHLFNEEKQLELARKLAALLSPEPGSMLFGMHVGRPEKGLRVEAIRANSKGTEQGVRMFCHCPESWTEMWVKDVFGEGNVKVEANLVEVERDDMVAATVDTKVYMMCWSVVRL